MTVRDPIRPAILNLAPNAIAEVSRMGLGDPDIIPLWFGETDLVTPAFIRDAAKQALDEGKTFYTFAGGIPQLRSAIQAWTTRWYGTTPDINRIWVVGAAMLCVTTALQCCVETGDEVVVVMPMWPNISQAAQAVGATPVYLRLDHDAAAGRWVLDLDKLEAAIGPRTKAIFIGTPGNPTGWVLSDQEIQAVLEISRRRGVAIIADEVYSTLYYAGKRAPSFLDHATEDDNVFIVNSFSKAWAMTGWRIGWVVAPSRLSQAMAQLSVSNNTGATVFAQWGAVSAIERGDDFIAEMVARCRAGREIVRDFVASQNRLSWVEPDGAFYAYIAVDGLTDSLAFAKDLVRTARVGVAPGRAFACGPNDTRDEAYLRLCFAQSPERLKTGLGRIADALNR
ncbi:MAG: pyridoxal phosphate-dependent aminotransferase [Alphaproteobacteria bacterium]|nr:pyridoxal phosphate-dependent aminotransferase [Alphaproteobacteria bacterium]